MPYHINHIHLKAPDPKRTADWYARAFNLRIANDSVRPTGERFIRCESEDGQMAVNISAAPTGATYGPGDAGVHWGLEHFGFDSVDIRADVQRLVNLGATLLEEPRDIGGGLTIAFIQAPDDVRIELVQRTPQ